MKILCVVGFQPYWGTDLPPNVLDLEEGKSLGGGEENALRVAVGLKALGHDVTLYWYGSSGVWRGVPFHNLSAGGMHKALASEHWDVVAEWSSLRALERAPKGTTRLFVQQLNDLVNIGDWSSVDCVVSPSLNHAQQLPRWGWRNKPYAVVHNGLDIELYKSPVEGDASNGLYDLTEWSRRPMNVGYWSSPDRGLHHVLRAWPLVRNALPDARLHVFYEIERYLAFAVKTLGPYGDRARLLASLLADAKRDSTITFHGHVPRKKLARTQTQTKVQLYPYDPVDYCEGFCHPAGTMVLTADGEKAVEQIGIGDRVLGHTGNWRAVTRTSKREYSGKLFRIRAEASNAVEFTDDHPVLVVAAGEFKWLRADQIKKEMWLFSRTVKGAPLPDGAFALRVRAVESRPFEGPVYALTVDADASYHVGNFAVHNCGSVNQGIASGALVMTTPKDALPSLYGDSIYWLQPNNGKPGYHEYIAYECVQALKGKVLGQARILADAAKNAARYTWDRAAKEMEAACMGANWGVTGNGPWGENE